MQTMDTECKQWIQYVNNGYRMKTMDTESKKLKQNVNN